MYRLSLISVLFCLLSFPSLVFAEPTDSIVIQEQADGITIQSQQAPLGEVLDAIQNRIGIQFIVDESIWSDPVTVDLKVSDWKTGVEMVLEPFNQIAIWNNRLDRTKIKILSRNSEVSPELVFTNPKPEAVPHVTQEVAESLGGSGSGVAPSPDDGPSKIVELDKSRLPKSLGLEKKKLRRIGRGKLKSPMSPVFLSDPDMAVFLGQFGIHTPEDAKDTYKSMKALVHARRMIK